MSWNITLEAPFPSPLRCLNIQLHPAYIRLKSKYNAKECNRTFVEHTLN